MASSAGNGEALKSLRQRVDLVFHNLRLLQRHVRCRRGNLHQPQEARSEGRLVDLHRGIESRRQQIARHMLLHETVIRHIRIERADHVVAITPGLRDRVIAHIAARLAKAHQVQPVCGPVLAKLRALEKAVDEGFSLRLSRRALGHISNKTLHLLLRRRQAHQREFQPAQQGGRRCRCGGFQAFLLHLRHEKAVHRVSRQLRHRWLVDWLPGPVRTTLGQFGLPFFGGSGLSARRILGQPRQPHAHPAREICDHTIGQLVSSFRHLQVRILMADGLQQQTLVRRTRIHQRTALPAFLKPTAIVQPQAALGLLRAVAFVAMHHQHRPDA